MSKLNSLKKKYEFNRVYKKGRYAFSKHISIYIIKNNLEISRFGITASKKFGSSIKRNRIKRLIKENIRLFFLNDLYKKGYDIVIIARKNEVMPEFKQIQKEISYILKKLNIINR